MSEKAEAIEAQAVKPSSVRLTKEQLDRLDDLAEKLGTTKPALIRWGIDALLDYVDQSGGTLTLPLKYPQAKDS